MPLEIALKRDPRNRIRRAGANERGRRVRAINQLAEDPQLKGVEELTHRRGVWRYRVGGFRILYEWDATTLTVLAIETRGQAYR